MANTRKDKDVKRQLGPVERLYPMPCPIVVGGTMAAADALLAAWVGIAGSAPPAVMMALRNSRRTLELIRETGEFTLNTPRANQADVADFIGITSGRTHDKFAECGWTLVPSAVVSAPVIAECPYNLECRVLHEVTVGEYVVVIGEILETHADESVLDDAGTAVDVERLDPLIYIPGAREYRRVGEKVANAYSIGKTIAPVTPAPDARD